MKLAEKYQIVVLGGGVSGLGVALEAARLGRSVLLLEKGSLCAATSSNSLRIMHGGLRYLQTLNFARAIRSARDQEFLMNWAKEWIEPLACLLPLNRFGLKSWPFAQALSLSAPFVFKLCGISQLSSKVVGQKFVEKEAPFLAPLCRYGALFWQDAQLINPGAFHQLLRQVCEEAGAHILEGANVMGVTKAKAGFDLWFRAEQEERKVQAQYVVNCLGPWINNLTRDFEAPILSNSWAKAFNLSIRGKLSEKYALALPGGSSRMLFAVPRADNTALGTWYVKHNASADNLELERAEIEEMLQAFNAVSVARKLSLSEVVSYDCGLLPLKSGRAQDLELQTSERISNTDGYVQVLSTKYTTFRSQAQRVAKSLALQG